MQGYQPGGDYLSLRPDKGVMSNRISVVVPLFNEEDGLPLLVDKLITLGQRLALRYELECALVDDGSQDRALERLRECFNGTPNVITVSHGRKRGLGATMRTGFQHAKVVATIDADSTLDQLILPSLLEAMEREDADIAIGSPYPPGRCGERCALAAVPGLPCIDVVSETHSGSLW